MPTKRPLNGLGLGQCCFCRENGVDNNEAQARRPPTNDAPANFDWLRRPQENGRTLSKAELQADAERSRATLDTHRAATRDFPELLVYWVEDPNRAGVNGVHGPGEAGIRRPNAMQIHQNASEPVPVDSPAFEGKALWMQRLPEDAPATSRGERWQSHFNRKERNWELRLQGRFKRVPKGKLYVGIVLRDFNYDQAIARSSQAAKSAGTRLIPFDDSYSAWGDRCQEAEKKDAELAHLVADLAGWDQIIVTPDKETPPDITEPLKGLGFERKALGVSVFGKEVREACADINTTDTYTFCFWGCSQYVNMLGWQFTFRALRLTMKYDMTTFFQEWPIHACMYELDTSDNPSDTRHLESRKYYYIDFMFWNSTIDTAECLPERYNFHDTLGVDRASSGDVARKQALARKRQEARDARVRSTSSSTTQKTPTTPTPMPTPTAKPSRRLPPWLSNACPQWISNICAGGAQRRRPSNSDLPSASEDPFLGPKA